VFRIDLNAFRDNWILTAILLLALACYYVLFQFLIAPRTDEWRRSVDDWMTALQVLLSTLPLLGLLGTIVGLLETFRQMSSIAGVDQQTLLSGGVADALLTTQLGLVTVVPGWLLFSYLKSAHARTERHDAQ
jgi:biopolymer transport protein ExbB